MTGTLETTFTFRNTESTDALKDHAEDKLSKLDKYLRNVSSAHVIFNVEGARHTAEITLAVKGNRIVGVGTSNDMYASVDEAVEKIKKQVSKLKDRKKSHKGE